MSRRNRKLPQCAVLGAVLGCISLPLAVQAADRGWYVGADAVQLETTLDYGYTETYTSSHVRLKAGYQIMDFLSVEGRLMSSGHDTDISLDPLVFGNEYRFETGSMLGFYARPHTNFRNANVYGIVGLTGMNTRYRLVGTAFTEKDLVFVGTIGVGGDFRIAGNLFFTIEAQMYSGSANYPAYFVDYVDLYGVGLSAGLRYQF